MPLHSYHDERYLLRGLPHGLLYALSKWFLVKHNMDSVKVPELLRREGQFIRSVSTYYNCSAKNGN